ncbi:MAG: hypothetical protein LBO67_07905 [Spirochaetaceae bacterium]|jgi:hypothetical protein|nr:hypothetical protein [Spirochaetaceae bacterium]
MIDTKGGATAKIKITIYSSNGSVWNIQNFTEINMPANIYQYNNNIGIPQGGSMAVVDPLEVTR